jgi:cell division septation protein DedD
MIKYLFIVINSLAVFIYGLFSGDSGITVTGSIPTTFKAGSEVQVEIKISKGSMAGFAKFQLELPDGIAVKETENKGANYTYNAGIAKWVWASLPAENDVIIKMTLISSVEAAGVKTISAKFSFVEDNAKQVVEMTPAEVTITAPDPETLAAANTTAPVTTENPAATKPDSTSPATSSSPVPVTQNNPSNAEPVGNISAARTITKNNNEYTVNLKIKKDGTKGFARYSDDLPDGLIVKASKTDGSSFSVGDGKLKFVWVNVPEKEDLELEYTVSGNSREVLTLNGEYSYLEDNQSKKYTLKTDQLDMSLLQGALAETPKEEKTERKTETKSNEIVENTRPSTETKMEQTLSKKDGTINYHVQIGAFTNVKVTADKLKKKFQVSETIASEMQGGFSKFMVGTHGEYKEARDHREVMKTSNGIKSSFVVAYNSGKRITVQEALMITSQKWFK